ncbi:MAG: radical SAM protein [Tissierellia bacterium]|nr:radical SAM protein [Tissierellia bacterium]
MDIFKRYKNRDKSHHMGGNMMRFISGKDKLSNILNEKADRENNVIYLHIPFCTKICSFCNMRRQLSDVNPEYVNILVKHIEKLGKTPFAKSTTFDSIYFGGGTPTTMTTEELTTVLRALRSNFNLTPSCEISSETTLTELPAEKLVTLSNEGLNRISVGVQTFNDNGRKLMGRIGNGAFAKERLQEYLDTGFKGVNIDLIYNYPYQTEDDLDRDLELISNLDIAGFSLYSLILVKDSMLTKKISKKEIEIKTDLVHDYIYYHKVVEAAKKSGYEFLELTKMVRPGRDEYKYIVHRNTGAHTLPIGAGAGGNIGGAKIMNPIKLDEYAVFVDNLEIIEAPIFSDRYETIQEAVDQVQFGRIDLKMLPEDLVDKAKNLCEELVEADLVEKVGDIYELTELGKFWGNNVSQEYFDLMTE